MQTTAATIATAELHSITSQRIEGKKFEPSFDVLTEVGKGLELDNGPFQFDRLHSGFRLSLEWHCVQMAILTEATGWRLAQDGLGMGYRGCAYSLGPHEFQLFGAVAADETA